MAYKEIDFERFVDNRDVFVKNLRLMLQLFFKNIIIIFRSMINVPKSYWRVPKYEKFLSEMIQAWWRFQPDASPSSLSTSRQTMNEYLLGLLNLQYIVAHSRREMASIAVFGVDELRIINDWIVGGRVDLNIEVRIQINTE